MALTYTTIDAIERRLTGRLSIGGGQAPYGKISVDRDLFDQVGAQVEAKINAELAGAYKLPLNAATITNTDSRPILAAIVEKGVVCELADVHFFATEEGNSYGKEMCRQFKADLAALVSGELRLPGEALKAVNDLSNQGYSAAATRSAGVAEEIVW